MGVQKIGHTRKRKIHPVQWGLLLLPAAVAVWFSQTLLIGVAGVGTLVGWMMCAITAALILLVPGMIRKGGGKQVAAWILTIVFALGMVWCGYLTTRIFSAAGKTPPETATVVVLGCKVEKSGAPSLSLKSRIEKAAEYLQEHPEAVCIVSGGKGSNEPATEASVMARELESLGIDSQRIIQEDQSTDTRENMEYSAKIIEENGLSREIAVVTDDYHQFRAGELAKAAGLSPYAVPAESVKHLFPANYGRELISLTKFYLEQWF